MFLEKADPPMNVVFRINELSWDPPANDGGFEVLGYLLSWRKEGETQWRKVRKGGAVTSRTFRPTFDAEYCVHAETEVGVSKGSTPCTVTLQRNGLLTYFAFSRFYICD